MNQIQHASGLSQKVREENQRLLEEVGASSEETSPELLQKMDDEAPPAPKETP